MTNINKKVKLKEKKQRIRREERNEEGESRIRGARTQDQRAFHITTDTHSPTSPK